MFQISLSDDLIKIPASKTNTKDIIQYISPSKCNKNKRLVFLFNSIYLPQKISFNLADIGYSIDDILCLTPSDSKKAYFSVLPFKFLYIFNIDLSINVFSVKAHFSKIFFTVPPNIVVKLQDQILGDDILLYEKIDRNAPFVIEVGEEYALYYTFYQKFRFICMAKDSTIENLEDTISIYSQENLYSNHTKQEIDPLFQLTKLTKSKELIEFVQTDVKNDLFPIEIEVIDNEKNFPKFLLDFQASSKTKIYKIKIFLEKYYKIDRKLFVAFDVNDEMIQNDVFIDPEKHKRIKVKILSKLQVLINKKKHSLSYFTSIRDIKSIYKFDKCSFGLIINNQFAVESSSNFLLCHFLNNSNDPDSLTNIEIKMQKSSCHDRMFVEWSEKGEEISKKHFIIPDKMKDDDEIIFTCLKRNLNSINVTNKENGNYDYMILSKLNIEVNLINDKGKSESYKFEIGMKEPRVMDLFHVIYENRKSNCPRNKIPKYQAFLGKSQLDFYMKLSDIPYTRINLIKIHEKYFDFNEVKVYKFYENEEEISYNPTLVPTTKEIIKKLNLHGTLFMDYNALQPDDLPLIYIPKNNFLIFNISNPKSSFRISNGKLEINYELKDNLFEKFNDEIKSIFGIKDIEAKFKLIHHNEEYELPQNFDARSLPNNSLILIDYEYQTTKAICVNYNEKIHVIKIKDAKVPISTLKPQIMEALNCYKYSENALFLSFQNKKLSPEKSFDFYKITQSAILNIFTIKSSIIVKVQSSNLAIDKIYYFQPNETVKSLEKHLQAQFKYNKNISITLPGNKSIDGESKLSNNIEILISTKPIKILYHDTKISIEQLVLVSEANMFIQAQLKQDNVYIFTFNEDQKCYEIADRTKRLYEFDCQLFVHKILPNIKFYGFEMRFPNEYMISDQNTLAWFKKEIIAPHALTSPENIVITSLMKPIDEKKSMSDLVNGPRMTIDIKERATGPSANTSKKPKLNPSKFMPKISKTKEEAKEELNEDKAKVKEDLVQIEEEEEENENDEKQDIEHKNGNEELQIEEEEENENDEKQDIEHKNGNEELQIEEEEEEKE